MKKTINYTADEINIRLGKVTRLEAHLNNIDNPHAVTKDQVGLGNVTNDAQVKRSEMGVANGVATLDSTGKVLSAQLPSYVDDVIEYESKSAFPTTGESGKIYVAKDTNITYRWSGSSYIEISQSLALGETSTTAYAGDKGKKLREDVDNILLSSATVETNESGFFITDSNMNVLFEVTSEGCKGYKLVNYIEEES